MWKITKKNIFKKKALKARNYNFIYYVKIYLQAKNNYISASLSPALSSKTLVTNWWKRWKSLHDPKFTGRLLKGLAAESWKVCFSIGIAICSVSLVRRFLLWPCIVMAEANIRARYSYVSHGEQIWGGTVPSFQGWKPT